MIKLDKFICTATSMYGYITYMQ